MRVLMTQGKVWHIQAIKKAQNIYFKSRENAPIKSISEQEYS